MISADFHTYTLKRWFTKNRNCYLLILMLFMSMLLILMITVCEFICFSQKRLLFYEECFNSRVHVMGVLGVKENYCTSFTLSLQSKNGILQFQNGNGYVVVSSQDQDEGLNHTVVNEGPNVTQVEEKPSVLLSTAQLILRRGLITLAALLILAVGVAVHLIVPLAVRANTTLDSNFTTPSSLIHSTSISV